MITNPPTKIMRANVQTMTRRWIAVIGAGWLAGVVGHAATVDFEMDEGYVAGRPLVTQPGDERALWNGSEEFGEVVVDEGVEGGQAAGFELPGGFATVWMEPSRVEELGDKVKYSFAVMLTELKPSSFDVPVRIRAGLEGEKVALRVNFYAGGKVEFYDGDKPVRVKEESGEDFFVREGVYAVVSGVIDLKASTVTVAVNDVAQTGTDGEAVVGFNIPGEGGGIGRFEIMNAAEGAGNFYVDQVTFETAD